MKKIKISYSGMLDCPKNNKYINANLVCKNCDDCFGVVPYDCVLCKRGLKKDIYLSKKERPDKK